MKQPCPEWNTRHQKLAQLRQALVIETNAATRFNLEHQIQAETEEMNRLEELLSEIER